MSDTGSKDRDALLWTAKPAAHKLTPGTALFSFRMPDHRQVDCELRGHGEVTAGRPGFISIASSHDHVGSTREAAIQWAGAERKDMVRGWSDVEPACVVAAP